MDRRQKLIEQESSKKGLRGKINAYCISCTYDQANPGNWRQQVTNCSVPECPLYPVRPASKAPLSDKQTEVVG